MRIGVQLYTLRDQLDNDLPGTFSRLQQIGYKVVETAGLHGLTPDQYRKRLDEAGLNAVSCHVGLPDVEGNLDETAAMAKALGATWLVVPWIGEETYGAGWAQVGERMGKVAENVLKKGLKFGYHNHAFEFDLEDGIPGFARFWDAAPVLVEAELDLYWAHYAGHEPSQWLRNLSGRVSLAHFKDGKDGKFTPVGEGEIDWKVIKQAAELAGVEYAIVELDECPRDPIDCVESSFNYLKGIGLSA